MANQITVFNNATEWEGTGQFTPAMLAFGDFDRWFNMATMEFHNVVRRYESSVEDDGRIDLIEKVQITKELDDFLNCLIALRFNLLDVRKHYSVENPKWGFAYSIERTEDLNGWQGAGRFTKKYRVSLEKFAHWYEHVMLDKFNQLSASFKKATADNFIDDTERQQLYAIVDLFFFDVLVVRHYIQKGIWAA